MSYCFTEHGLLPSDFRKIPFKDKAIMIAALQYKAEQQEKELKKQKEGKR